VPPRIKRAWVIVVLFGTKAALRVAVDVAVDSAVDIEVDMWAPHSLLAWVGYRLAIGWL
jgi:hypothetical protein